MKTGKVRSFMPAMHACTVDLYPITFSCLDLCQGSQDECKTQPVKFMFKHTPQQIRVKLDVTYMQFKLNQKILC